MKTITKMLLYSLNIFFLFCFTAYGQNAGDFQSHQSGSWVDVTTWEQYDGVSWVYPASITPDSSSGVITILNTHTVTLTVDTVANEITINAGGTLKIDSVSGVGGGMKTLKVTDTTGADLTVNGTLINRGTVTLIGAATLVVGNGGTYEHARSAGSIPIAIWNTGSTCLVTGTTGASPGNGIQNFYNFTWNCPGQTTGLNLAWDNVTIGGNLTVTASGVSAAQQFRMTSAATTRTITINGNVIVNGGYLTVSGSSGAAQYNVTVKGNIDIQSGKFNLCGGSGGFGTWRLWGNLTVSGSAQFVVPSNKTPNTRLIFAGGGAQQYTYTSSVANANLSYGVEDGSIVTLNSPLTVGNTTAGNGALVLTNGKFVTTSTNVITLASGAYVYSTYSANVGTGISAVNASPVGYVDGPLATTIATASAKADTLPIGKGSYYRPTILTITQDAATSTIYTGEIFNAAPTTRTIPSGLDAVNSARYLKIVKGTGAAVTNATIQMSYNTGDDSVGTNSMIRVAKDDKAGNWINLGGSGTANNTGTIFSDAFTALDTNDFVIAHVDPLSLPMLATLSSTAITDISTTFATGGGNITNSGNAAITARGICWNTSASPDTNNSKTSNGSGSGAFTSSITGLSAGTLYYVRAYAINSAGIAYGDEVTFTTLTSLDVPTLAATTTVTSIINTSASSGGTITAWGGSAITDRGVCWSLSHNPTLVDEYNSIGAGGTGSFITSIGGLSYGQTYYVRSYATNSTGTGYGAEVSFSSPALLPDVTKIVDINGTVGVDCDYTNIQDAFDAVTSGYTGHWFIYVKNGTYYDKVTLAAGKINVVLVGQDKNNTVITYDDYAGRNRTTHGVLSNGTNTSYSCAIDASDFQAQNITFQNTANAYAPGSSATQAVALRTNGDRQSYYNCRMLGYQDTYYTQGGLTGPDRIYNKNCYIEGSVDFIFGRDVALFDSCTIYCNRQGGVLTAAATEVGYSYGYVFLDCILGSPAAGVTGVDSNAMTTFYLGRPWQASPKTVFLNCYEPATVNAAGWTVMGPNPSLYSEYNCYGPGAASRPVMSVAWPGANQPSTITSGDAANYTIANIFSKNNKGSGFSYAANWVPSQIPFTDPALPVELASFKGSLKNGKIELAWRTATEINNAGFEIERKSLSSKEEKSGFMKIGFVAGSGSSNSPKEYSFIDKSSTGKCVYRLKQIDNDGKFKYSLEVEVNVGSASKIFSLNQNYPNPFNPSTTIDFTIPSNGRTIVKIYNMLGQEVVMLLDQELEAGLVHTVTFDAARLSSGIYFARLQFAGQQIMKKMMLMK